jgi:hypothetical protein
MRNVKISCCGDVQERSCAKQEEALVGWYSLRGLEWATREDKLLQPAGNLEGLPVIMLGPAGARRDCDFGEKRCEAGTACIGFKEAKSEDAARGICHVATAAYVPSYSLHFGCKVTVPTTRTCTLNDR